MTLHGDPDLDAIEMLSGMLAAALRSITHDQWSLATPCGDWDLRALVDHVTGGNWFTGSIFQGIPSDQAMAKTMEQFSEGSATSEQAASSVIDQLAAFRRPGVLDQTFSHVVGDLTGRQILRLRLHDLIVHTWDIEQTLDPPAVVPENLVRWGREELAAVDSLTAKHFQLAPASSSEVPLDLAAAYLARFGR